MWSATAQKKPEYIVISDSIYREGYLQGPPPQANAIYFKRTKRDQYQKYTIEEITEFYVNHRKYFTRELALNGVQKTVFLQLLPQQYDKYKLWKLVDDKNYFFVEGDSSLILLDENYKKQLFVIFDNPLMEKLIDITNYSEGSLMYVFQTAETISKPRTFSKAIAVQPFIGMGVTTNEFKIPTLSTTEKVSGSSLSIGLNLELFVTQSRNLSIILSPTWSKIIGKEFIKNSEGLFNYETDYAMDYTMVSLPVMARYYLEIKPNIVRAYAEFGYAASISQYDKLELYQAVISEGEIVTNRTEFELGANYQGIVGGLGLEYYLRKARALTFGIRGTSMGNSGAEKFKNLGGFIGFKF